MNLRMITLAGNSCAVASYHQPQGSIWHFPQPYRSDEHSKVLLMAPSYDRSGGIGIPMRPRHTMKHRFYNLSK